MRTFVSILVLLLGGCVSAPAVTPPLILEPPSERAVIRTLVLVERMGDLPAATRSTIAADFEYAERLYRSLRIEFDYQVFYVPTDLNRTSAQMLIEGGKLSKGTFTVWYGFPNRKDNIGYLGRLKYRGEARFPWCDGIGDGAVVLGSAATRATLAHEVGHWLGLYHVYAEDDGVEDTDCVMEGSSRNIMDVPEDDPGGPRTVTPGQLERMRLFLWSRPRTDCVSTITYP